MRPGRHLRASARPARVQPLRHARARPTRAERHARHLGTAPSVEGRRVCLAKPDARGQVTADAARLRSQGAPVSSDQSQCLRCEYSPGYRLGLFHDWYVLVVAIPHAPEAVAEPQLELQCPKCHRQRNASCKLQRPSEAGTIRYHRSRENTSVNSHAYVVVTIITGIGSPPYDTWRCHMTVVSYDGPEVSYDGGVV